MGTADDTGRTLTYWEHAPGLRGVAFQRPMCINHPGSDANYKSFEVAAMKRLSNRWQLQAAYTATKKHMPVSVRNAEFNPNAEINTSDFTWEWLSRVTASYRFPLDIQVSTNIQSFSGDTWGRTVSVRGGRTIPSLLMRASQSASGIQGSRRRWDLRWRRAFD